MSNEALGGVETHAMRTLNEITLIPIDGFILNGASVTHPAHCDP